MATYYYAAYFNTPLHQSPAALASQHPFGISSHPEDLPKSPAKMERQDSVMSDTERRILHADGKIDGQQDSIFFRLPAELRNQIYEQLLCPDTPSLKSLAKHDHYQIPAPSLHSAILSTCRRIHEEATDLLYTTHVFHAHQTLLTSLPHFESAAKPVLYPNMIAKINRWQLHLRLDIDPRFTTAQATAAFSNAEYLEIRVWQSTFDGADCSALRLFLGVRGVRVAKVGGSAKPELARWLEKRMMEPVEELKKKDLCSCGNASGITRCGECHGRMEGLGEWFGGRNVWQYGER